MAIELSIFGFADDRPATFQGKNHIQLTLDTPATPWAAMRKAGFMDNIGLVLLINDRVVPEQDWGATIVRDGDKLTVLSALEGG